MIYNGMDLSGGYGMQYLHNFIHHTLEIPGLHGRGGIYFVRRATKHCHSSHFACV